MSASRGTLCFTASRAPRGWSAWCPTHARFWLEWDNSQLRSSVEAPDFSPGKKFLYSAPSERDPSGREGARAEYVAICALSNRGVHIRTFSFFTSAPQPLTSHSV